MPDQQSELMKVTEVQRLLGVSKKKMAALLAEGTLSYTLNPLDKRVKLINREDVERLMEPRQRMVA
jgi:predicted site-specific integrase-resolvase